MKRRAAVVGIGLVAVVPLVWAAAAAQGPRPNEVSDFMKLKLIHSQKVLEGIAVEDFDMIAKHAQQMGLLAQDANWMVYQTPQYRHHSAEFQQIAEQLSEAAKKKNLDGAALAYVQLTMSCVNCHKYTRGLRMARLGGSTGRPGPNTGKSL